MKRWVRDLRTFLRWRKGATLVLFVYPASLMSGAEIRGGRIELKPLGQMYPASILCEQLEGPVIVGEAIIND